VGEVYADGAAIKSREDYLIIVLKRR